MRATDSTGTHVVTGTIDLVHRQGAGWRVVDFIEINGESGPSFEVTIESGDRQTTLLIAEGKRIVGERR